MSRYVKTLSVSQYDTLKGVKPGQWIVNDAGSRGQYLGETQSGNIVINWLKGEKFNTYMAKCNRPLRQFAKVKHIVG